MGASVEGMGKVVPGLNIDGKGTAVKIVTASKPALYAAPNDDGPLNGALIGGDGFSDYKTKSDQKAHLYTFTFAAGTTVDNFSLRMLDYGDLNPTSSTNHKVTMTAYNATNQVVAVQELNYTSSAEKNPRSSALYGDLWFSGDAASSTPGQPGNWTWNVSGSGIVKVVLSFGVGYDPNIGFDTLSFTTYTLVGCGTTTPSCTSSNVAADFSKVAVGASVEGMGKVVPGLNIDGKGTAVKIVTASKPALYAAPNDDGPLNGALIGGDGFSDYKTKSDQKAHLYTFTFAAGTTVDNFSLRMLDYGDLNPTSSTNHKVTMTAYNATNQVVAVQELNYTSSAEKNPRSSALYGDLWFSGDAASSTPGQPGNWTWNVSGSGIVKVVLSFGVGYDPNIGFDTLSYHQVQCP